MEINFVNLTHIDTENSRIIPTEEIDKHDLINYSDTLFNKMLKADDERLFEFKTLDKEVIRLITDLYSELNNSNIEFLFNNTSEKIATSLLDVQISTSTKINFPIQEGSLLQLFRENEHFIIYILAKIETDRFLDTEDLKTRSGLPFEDQTQKSCIIFFNKDYDPDNLKPIKVAIRDSTKRLAKYWYSDFLDLEELSSDKLNTRNAIKYYDKRIKEIEKISKLDYINIRNNFISYFQTNNEFNSSTFIDYVVGDYKPKNDEFSIQELKIDLMSLPNKKNFDTKFNVIKDEIKNRRITSMKINNDITLRLENPISELRNMINYSMKNGDCYLNIRVDDENTISEIKKSLNK